MTDVSAELQRRLQAVREAYAQQLPARLDAIEDRWRSLQNRWDRESAGELYRAFHSLSGSGATFGYQQLSVLARKLELQVDGWLQQPRPPTRAQRQRLALQLAALRGAAVPPPDGADADPGASARPRNPTPPLVYLLEDDPAMADELGLQLSHFGYETTQFADTEALETAIAAKLPAAVIADIIIDHDAMAGTRAITAIHARHGEDLPVVFVTQRDDFEARLGAVRAGGRAYFTKPVDIALLVDALDHLTRHGDDEPYRILIVDDDQTLATHYALTLQQAGMQVSTCSRPQEVLDTLADNQPELILMDVYMPHCSGPELALLIRQQESFLSIPILFLSTETDVERQALAMHTGGDDFLTKPIGDRALVSSVSLRAERARTLGKLIDKDSLTGLLKHTKIKEQLAVELSRARRNQTALAFAMIDIDHFKQVNDRHGHLTGDRVIKSLARLLRQRLRNTDIVGRYGGEEFAAILPQCDTDEAAAILNEIREHFQALRFLHGEEEFSVSFSAGLAAYPPLASAEEITEAADTALYVAKRKGRNRITVAKMVGGKPQTG